MSCAVDHAMTRRRFLLMSAMGGAAGLLPPLAYAGAAHEKERSRLTDVTALVRNPAFAKRTQANRIVLLTTTANGEALAYGIDSAGAFLWSNVPTPEDQRRGKTVTVRALLDLAVEKYGQKNGATVRREALAFVKQAFDAGILVGREAKFHIIPSRVPR